MPNRWADRLPRVTLPLGPRKPVTLVLPYYENPVFFAYQVAQWRGFSPELLACLSVIVVDDGSPQSPAALPDDPPCAMRLFRLDVDVRWNWLAARNIGAFHAADGWLLLTDMDHVLPAATLRHLTQDAHDPAVIYAFTRREHTGQPVAPHSASFFLTRDLFWATGGYDEALAGYYGTDGEFRRRAAVQASFAVLPQVLIRHERDGDAGTTRYGRKEPQDARVQALIAARGPDWRPRTRSFPYHEVNGC